MRSIKIILCFLVSTILISALAEAIELTPKEVESLTTGDVVRRPLPSSRKNGFYGGTGIAIIDAPVDVVWKALEDWEAYPKIFPRTVEAKELSRKGDRSLVRILLGYKVLSVKYHITISRDWANKTISFELAKNQSHDINATRGYWKLLPQPDGRTLVAYAVVVQVPPGIVAFLGESTEKSMERCVIGLPKYLKKFIEKDESRRYNRMTAKVP